MDKGIVMNNQVEKENADFACPDCGSGKIRVETVEDSFDYGVGAEAVRLKVPTELYICIDCGEEFMTEAGASARHDAVCRHLGLLTPGELKSAREEMGLSQMGLAELSRLGVASIARWEAAKNLQTKANDNYLRLLLGKQIPDNAEFIRRHNSGEETEARKPRDEDLPFKPYALSGSELRLARQAGEKFSLRRLN
jgi:putative zinc finger/helix-turn-helix YgiT family protein